MTPCTAQSPCLSAILGHVTHCYLLPGVWKHGKFHGYIFSLELKPNREAADNQGFGSNVIVNATKQRHKQPTIAPAILSPPANKAQAPSILYGSLFPSDPARYWGQDGCASRIQSTPTHLKSGLAGFSLRLRFMTQRHLLTEQRKSFSPSVKVSSRLILKIKLNLHEWGEC